MTTPFTWLLRNFAYVGCAGFLCLYFWVSHSNKTMRQRGKYTIGYVTGWTQTLKSGRSIDYRCSINGAAYTGSVLEEKGMNSAVGARYLVEYDSMEPSNHWVYYKDPIAPNIKEAPVNGWDKRAILAGNDTARLVAQPY